MHPDDQAPPAPPRPKHPFPYWLMSLMFASSVSWSVAISGATTWSQQWWSIIVAAVVFFSVLRGFLWALALYVGDRATLTISNRNDDTSI